MRFYAFHGVFEEEQKIGTKYKVELDYYGDFLLASKADTLDQTVDYSKVYSIVEAEMKISSKLIEHVAYRIINRIKDEFPLIKKVHIKLSKLKPPIEGELDAVSVELEE